MAGKAVSIQLTYYAAEERYITTGTMYFGSISGIMVPAIA